MLFKRLFQQVGADRRCKTGGLGFDRQLEAQLRRNKAAQVAADRPHLAHESNGEESLAGFPGSFRKGLAHRPDGFLADDRDYPLFRQAIRSGLPDDLANVPTPVLTAPRRWESPSAGFVFDLEGPDAQAVTMPPAPTLDSAELAAEMAEVFAMAHLRDVPFAEFDSQGQVGTRVSQLNALPWFSGAYVRRPAGQYTVSAIFDQAAGLTLGRQRGAVTRANLFRGVTTGDEAGPLISQFLLVGNPSRGDDATGARPAGSVDWDATAGKIRYGANTIDQRVRVATPNLDFMTTPDTWLAVQQGANVGATYQFDYNDASYTSMGQGDPNEGNGPAYRFILTPRDLATYVHFDQLYQAYLNACLILLERGIATDPDFRNFNSGLNQQGFAQFGGPHILSLVTEVATRALKAVRFQKFNIHNRARPEAIAGLFEQIRTGSTDSRLDPLRATWATLDRSGILPAGNHLLPMAFPEGSPMHPSYGAGHATVAGACVTLLKAFFDHTAELPGPVYEADPATAGRTLRMVSGAPTLTVEGELNKLASNISIGRNMAGVHYFSDYIESIRMGEQIALAMLEEQALMYNAQQFPFAMTVPLFDGGTVVIGTKG